MAGETPASPSSSDRDPIERLADSFIARFRAGERPSVEEYARKYPELADEIRDLLPALVELELNNSPGGTATGDVVEVAAGSAPRQLGDYLILREIGRGGMGVVYEAVQQSLGRHVALKVLPSSSLAGTSHLERFRLEARSAARLHHTNIVPVFGVGEQDGVHYYAMQFIQGQGLDEVFEELRRLRAARSQAATPSSPAGSDPARARTLAATQGLLTGRFAAGAEPAGTGGDPEAPGDPAGGSMTEAGTAEPAPTSSHAGKPDGSGISGHSELSGTQAEDQYYRSVARVGLQVAEALAYAHSQGIVHRDIKPSNLLLDARGTTWVTDFGLAKAEGADALTHTGDIVGTLRYMAPERFDGWSDPRSDVYSLGATLYELLTLRPMFQEPNRAKLIDRVMHDAPDPPRKLDRKVPRDLETIVLKAIAKEPGDRYATAEQMADDLRRFLADKPVLARRSSPAEQAWRWCRRNKGLATATAGAVLGLLTAVVVLTISNARIGRTSRDLAAAVQAKDGALTAARRSETQAKASAIEAEGQRRRAEAGEAQARAAVDQFLNRVTEDALLKAPGLQELRRDLLGSALRFYDEFLRQRGDDPGLRTALAEVHLRAGRIQGQLGDQEEARRSFRSAARLYESLSKEHPDDRAARAGLASCRFWLGEAAAAIAIWEELLKVNPANADDRRDLAEAYNLLGARLSDRNKIDESLRAYQKSLALREGLVRDFPDAPEYREALGQTLNNLGVLMERQAHKEDSLTMFLRAIEHSESALAKSPRDLSCAVLLGTTYRNAAAISTMLDRIVEAERWYRKAVEHWTRFSRENPSVPDFRASLYQACYDLGQFLQKRGRKAESAGPLRLAARTLEELPRQTPDDLYNLACVQALSAAAIGEGEDRPSDEVKAERHRLIEAAMDSLRRSIEGGGAGVGADHMQADDDLAILRDRDDFRALVARRRLKERIASAGTGTPEEKLKAVREALAAGAKLAAAEPRNPRHRADRGDAQHSIGLILTDLGRLDEAETALKEALAIREALAVEEPKSVRRQLDLGGTRLVLSSVSWRTSRLEQARREWTAALDGMEAAMRDEPADSQLWGELGTAWIQVADRLIQVALWEEADELLGRAFRRSPASFAANDRYFLYLHALFRLRAGDRAGYRSICSEFFRRFKDKENRYHLYKACLVGPGALDDMKALIPIADADLDRHRDDPGYVQCVGLIHMRAGDPAGGLRIVESYRTRYWDHPSHAWMLAVLYQSLGRVDDARRELERASRFNDDDTCRDLGSAGTPPMLPHIDWQLTRDLVQREVVIRLGGRPGADLPYVALARGRSLALMGREVEADRAFADALDARPGDTRIAAVAAGVLADLARGGRPAASGRVLSRFGEALATHPGDAPTLRARAELFAHRGEWDRAGADLLRLSSAMPSRPRWFACGTWIVGPYPFDGIQLAAVLAGSGSPESQTDPLRPVPGPAGPSALAWRAVTPAEDGSIDLWPLVQPRDHVSTYVLTRVYAAEACDVAALVAGDDWLRLWCNGEHLLDHRQPLNVGPEPLTKLPDRILLPLRPGWNTLLARVTNWGGDYYARIQLTDDPAELARGFRRDLGRRGWSERSAALLERIWARAPDHRGSWAKDDEALAAEVARRDDVFGRVIASRPEDSLLWAERGRHLAWLGKWDEALSAYERMIGDHRDPEDAFVEYAALLLLKGDAAAYRRWCTRLVERFDGAGGASVGSMLARSCGLAPEPPVEPSRLVRWAGQAVGSRTASAESDYALGLALLRAREIDKAVDRFRASIRDGEDSPRNGLALAMAHWRAGEPDEAARRYQEAESGMMQAEAHDRPAHPAAPVSMTDWLEAMVLRREIGALLDRGRLGDVAVVNRVVPAGRALRLPLGVVELRHDPPRDSPPGPFRIRAPFRTGPPKVDGRIEADEYGPPLAIDFIDDKNPGRLFDGSKRLTDPKDLAAELRMAYTRTDLFLAVTVRDDKVVTSSKRGVLFGDSVEFFIDGDRQTGDFKDPAVANVAGPEGFQIVVDADGGTQAFGIPVSEYAIAAAPYAEGYVVECRIPLHRIDTKDGVEFNPAGPGSTLRFNLAIADIDKPPDWRQDRYAMLWSDDPSRSPYSAGESVWSVDLHLARPVKYELVAGPRGAAIEPETGVLTWDPPAEPRAEKVTVRVRDVEKPELTAEASFTITTTAPR